MLTAIPIPLFISILALLDKPIKHPNKTPNKLARPIRNIKRPNLLEKSIL